MDNKKFIFVVGDKFKEFGLHDQVLTLSGLIDLLKQEHGAKSLAGTTLVAGQGISEADVQRIIDAAPHGSLYPNLLLNHPVRAGLHATHKRHIRNSIISSPRQIAADLYEVDLLVDERSELMSDHQTGQHIQGMILVEAARQMFLAVTETFFIDDINNGEYYFVINQMDAKYIAFAFPLGATLHYEILEKNTIDSERLSFFAKISVLQAKNVVTEVMVRFTAFLAGKIGKMEHRQAMLVLKKHQELLILSTGTESTA